MTSSSTTSTSSIRLGSYQLFERIGEGGSAQVYRARDASGRELAVKLLGPHAELDDPSAINRFKKEISTLETLRHDHLVALIDHGVDDELGPYLVTPLIPGQSLRALFASRNTCPEGVLLLLEPLLDAVAYLHERQLIHRDLKPENLVGTPEGDVVVVDLGLALAPSSTRHTRDGQVVGSVPYMAPEQLEGHASIGFGCDVWAIGVMAYEWLTGVRPFQRDRPSEEAAAALVGKFTPLQARDRRIAPELALLIESCLRPAPQDRPSAADLHARMASFIDWTTDARRRDERAAVLAEPKRYHERVSAFRAQRAMRTAREQIAEGELFAALKTLDRGLAYAPEHAQLLTLVEDAEAQIARAQPKPVAAPEPDIATARTLRRPRWSVVGLVAIASIVGLVLWLGRERPAQRTEPAPTARTPAVVPAEAPNLKEQAVFAIAGGLIDVFDRTLTLEERKQAEARLQALEPVVLDLPGLEPLNPAELDNDDVPGDPDLEAPAGEPLVARDRLGGADPATLLADLDRELVQTPANKEAQLARGLIRLAVPDVRGLADLQALTTAHPDFAPGWAARGFVAMRQGDYQQALGHLDRALAIDAKDPASRRNRGMLLRRLGKTRDAYVDLTRALAVDPSDLEALLELSKIYERAGKHRQAEPLLRRVVELRPRSARSWLEWSLTQEPADALASLDRAIELDASDPRAHARRCQIASELGRREADAQCTRAIELNPASAESFAGRARSRQERGKQQAARDDLARACELGFVAACAH